MEGPSSSNEVNTLFRHLSPFSLIAQTLNPGFISQETRKGFTKHAKELLSEGKNSISTRIKRRSAHVQSKLALTTPGHPQPPDHGDWEMEGLKVPALLIQGTPMTKYSEKKGPKSRVFRLDPDQGQILWPSRKSGISVALYLLSRTSAALTVPGIQYPSRILKNCGPGVMLATTSSNSTSHLILNQDG